MFAFWAASNMEDDSPEDARGVKGMYIFSGVFYLCLAGMSASCQLLRFTPCRRGNMGGHSPQPRVEQRVNWCAERHGGLRLATWR